METKLKKWLIKNNVTQDGFAKTCSIAAGWEISNASVCQWCNGARKPHKSVRLVIERLTGGKVRAGDW